MSRPKELYSQLNALYPRIFSYPKEFYRRYCNEHQDQYVFPLCPHLVAYSIHVPRIGLRPVQTFPLRFPIFPLFPVELFTISTLILSFICFCHLHWFCSFRFGHWNANGASNLKELFLLTTESCMIRRRKDAVLTELPKKYRQKVVIEIPKKCAAQMKKISKDLDRVKTLLKGKLSSFRLQTLPTNLVWLTRSWACTSTDPSQFLSHQPWNHLLKGFLFPSLLWIGTFLYWIFWFNNCFIGT